MGCSDSRYREGERPVTLNPWQHSEIGVETEYFNKQNAEYIKLSSPPIYTRIVKRALNLERVDLHGYAERDYLERSGKLDSLYEETEKTLLPGTYRVYGAYEIPIWTQELGKLGMAEDEEVTIKFNMSTLASNLDGSVLHMGDVLKVYDSIYGWKYYEITNALATGMMFGKYLMWQIIGIKTDLEGYTDLDEDNEIINHDVKYTKVDPNADDSAYNESQGSEPTGTLHGPRPRVY